MIKFWGSLMGWAERANKKKREEQDSVEQVRAKEPQPEPESKPNDTVASFRERLKLKKDG